MELALLLLLLVIAELVVSVWMLARHKMYLGRLDEMEGKMDALAAASTTADNALPPTDEVEKTAAALSGIAAAASPEEVEQAMAILAALGLDKAD